MNYIVYVNEIMCDATGNGETARMRAMTTILWAIRTYRNLGK